MLFAEKIKMKLKIYIYLFLIISSFTYAQVNLVLQTGHSNKLNDLCFSPDNKYLVSVGKESNVVIWDLKTGRQYASLDGHSKEVTSISFHPNQAVLATASADSTIILWDYENCKVIYHSKPFANKITSICYSSDGSEIYICCNSLIRFNTQTNTIIKTYSDYEYLKVITSKSGYLFSAKTNSNTFFASREGLNEIESEHIEAKRSLAIKKDDGLNIFTSGSFGNELVSYHLKKSKYVFSGKTLEHQNKYKIVSICSSKNLVAFGDKEKIIYVYGSEKTNKIFQLAGHVSLPLNLSVSCNEKWLASADENGMIFLWDLKTGNLANVFQAKLSALADAEISSDKEKLYLLCKNGDIKIWDIKNNTIVSQKFNGAAFLDNVSQSYYASRILKTSDSTISYNLFRITKYLTEELKKVECYIASYNSNTGQINLRENSKKKYKSYKNGNKKYKWQENEKNFDSYTYLNDFDINLKPLENTNGIVKQFKLSNLKTQVSIYENGFIDLQSNLTDTKIHFAIFGERDFIYHNDSSYYYASKGALLNVGYRFGNHLYDFNQFDIKYNRPDKILASLGFLDSVTLISAIAAHEKRLKLSNNKQDIDLNKLPELIIETPINLSSTENKISFRIKSKNEFNNLQSIHVSINGVPFPNIQGLKTKNSGALDTIIQINVEYGSNYIQTYLTDNLGNKSFTENFTFNCLNTESKKSNLYLVAIGSSSFIDKSYNLTYPSKDANDFEQKLKKSKVFKSVNTLKINDSEVTKSILPTIKSFLSTATESDVIIVFYAGHGLLDKKLNYYLSTADINFEEPELKGLSMDSIENMLGEMKCRKKLMFIDACHSGEIDKEDIAISSKTSSTNNGEIKFRAVGNQNVSNKNIYGAKSSIEISKMLFADTRLNSGLNIISSAGAAEYAIEGNTWKNGVFTYSLLYGITSNEADLNKDGEIWVSEIQEYLSKKVYALTNGKQSPTSRKENLITNFRIW